MGFEAGSRWMPAPGTGVSIGYCCPMDWPDGWIFGSMVKTIGYQVPNPINWVKNPRGVTHFIGLRIY